MNMKTALNTKIIVVLAVVLLTAIPLLEAQQVNDRTVKVTAPQMAAQMQQELGLSDEQVAKIIPILEYHLQERQKLYRKERQGASKKALRQEVRALRANIEAQLAQIITPEQLAKSRQQSK